MTHDKFLQACDLSKPLPSPVAKRVAQFMTRRKAEKAAQSIGWSAVDAIEAEVMGFRIWIISDPHGNAVTRDAMLSWVRERERAGRFESLRQIANSESGEE